MLDELKKAVCEANLKLVAEGLVMRTFGNVSGIDRAGGHVVIKPSGVPYDEMHPAQMVVVSLETGRPVEGDLRPSSDTPTHLVLYRAFGDVGAIAHTHSLHAAAWAQARREIPPLGTTHADHFHGPVPLTRLLRPAEIQVDYEANIGRAIVERFAELDPLHMPAVLVADHGPVTWGRSPEDAVDNAVLLEFVASLAGQTTNIEPYPKPLQRDLLDRHFLRKHGPDASYGQP
jgi:L-ribulose-5-phosphate 4-epimerase